MAWKKSMNQLTDSMSSLGKNICIDKVRFSETFY